MDDRVILKKNKDIVSRIVDDELILVPLYKTDEDINCIYTLNEAAAKIWECIDDKSTIEEIKKRLTKKYNSMDPKIVDKGLNEFIKDLKEIKALE